jgi:hypothetical protein
MIVTKASWGEGVSVTAVPKREPVVVGKKADTVQIDGVVFNFPDCFTRVAERLVKREVLLDGEGWSIVIQAQPSIGDVVEGLRTIGGYGLTHRIEIKKTDGAAFTFRSAQIIFEELRWLLSFACGAHNGPGLTRGISAESEVLWQAFGFPERIDRWSTTYNWFTHHDGAALRDVFPGFMTKWRSTWRRHLTSVIDMYAEANRDEPDVAPSLILAQAALELLSWLVLVEHGHALSSDGFRSLTAADQFRLLLHQFEIPAEIPAPLTELIKTAIPSKSDGPGILTGVRNSLVHPGKKSGAHITPYVTAQAWLLSMWYVELALLHIFEYKGQYFNRLKKQQGAGAVEPVPWAH